MKRSALVALGFFLCATSPLLAEDPSYTNDFTGAAGLPEGWKKGPGEWAAKDGVLHGKELAADEHAAVVTLGRPFEDGSISFRFKIVEAKVFSLSFNHSKGHLSRVHVGPTVVRLIKDKNKKDPTSKSVALKTSRISLADGKWHTMKCTFEGEKMTVVIDDAHTLEGADPAFDTKKTGHRFVVGKGALELDDVKVWDAK